VALVEIPDGFQAVTVRGFETRERRVGAPDLPLKTVLVAIPPGAVPRLEVRSAGDEIRPGIRPRPVPALESILTPEEAEAAERAAGAFLFGRSLGQEKLARRFEADRAVYSGTEPYPGRLAWLGRTGILREQRYVEVHLAPYRFDPRLGGLRIARPFEVTVHFDGDWRPGAVAPRSEGPFESVYRRTFLNYGQGTTFRIGELSGPQTPVAPSAGTDSTTPRQRIRVRANGPVRLDYARMSGTGFLSEPLSSWKLADLGLEVPLQIQDDGDDLLEPGEWVQFYGQALDFDPKTVFNYDFELTDDDIYEARDFGDENRYFLTVESGARSRIGSQDGAPTYTRPLASDFESVAIAEVDDAWRPLGPEDPWSWLPTLSLTGTTSRTDDVALAGLAGGTLPVRVVVRVQGRSTDDATNPDHRTRVTLMNASSQTLATNNDDGTFDGLEIYTHDFTWTHTSGPQLTSPAKVKLEVLSVSAPRNDVIQDRIEIHYRRSFAANGDTLVIDYPDGDAEFEVTGLSSSSPAIYEITGRLGSSGVVDPVRILGAAVTGSGPNTVRFRVDNDPAIADGEPRRFVVFGDGAVSIPASADFEADTVSDLRQSSVQADLIVIAHPDVLDDPANCSSTVLGDYLAHRLAASGLTSKVACMEDVEDEFNDGLAGPLAIKNFLAWVMSPSGWSAPKPTYVLLLGDGSYHYKGGTGSGNYVPTQILFLKRVQLGYYASDSLLAAVVGTDQLADLVVGRIPARTVAEVDRILQKVLDYEQTPAAGNWTRHALTVSDRGKREPGGGVDVSEALEFETTNSTGVGFMKRPPHTARQLRYWSDYCDTDAPPPQPCSPNVMRDDIKDAVNGVLAADPGIDGAVMVQYSGHGNFEVWSDDAFFDERDPAATRDTNDLVNGLRMPWLLAHNCLTGGFHTLLDHSMAEDWVLRDGGGAVAAFAPTGLSFNFVGREVTEVVWDDVYGAKKERAIAVPVLDSFAHLCGIGSIEGCQNYVLLGDPAMTLNIPSVAPPTDPQAVEGNAVVNLSWLPSADATSYDVYRTQSLLTAYTKINASPVTGTCGFDPSRVCYQDTGVKNTFTYYYYVVAQDGEGFESRWSNFNSDCDVSGPDCLRATPINPDPPTVPTGLAVADPETGGRLNLTWNANPEPDLNNYTVHWGTAPGVYTNVNNSGKNPYYGLTGLENGTRYYFAITATNTSNHTSAYSAEESGVPTWVIGEKAPGLIADLRLAKSGSDALLSWGAVTTDIYGKPETVASYEIYRGTTATFLPGPGNLIGTTAPTSFTDPAALTAGAPNYYYLVRAIDVDGNPGGLGRQLPDGILDLMVAKSSTVPNVVLSWPAVTDVFHPSGTGASTRIDHYEVYASQQPFSARDVRDGAVPLLTSVTGTSVEVTPPAVNQHYFVLAVDNRGNKSPF
jgi:hypothetical protein